MSSLLFASSPTDHTDLPFSSCQIYQIRFEWSRTALPARYQSTCATSSSTPIPSFTPTVPNYLVHVAATAAVMMAVVNVRMREPSMSFCANQPDGQKCQWITKRASQSHRDSNACDHDGASDFFIFWSDTHSGRSATTCMAPTPRLRNTVHTVLMCPQRGARQQAKLTMSAIAELLNTYLASQPGILGGS
jgi:hypothetical protein